MTFFSKSIMKYFECGMQNFAIGIGSFTIPYFDLKE